MSLLVEDTNLIALASDSNPTDGLYLRYGEEFLSERGNLLEAANDALPVMIEILDLEISGARWRVTASHLGANGQTVSWERDDLRNSSSFAWNATSNDVLVDVVAHDPASQETQVRPLYIRVRPKTIKPDA